MTNPLDLVAQAINDEFDNSDPFAEARAAIKALINYFDEQACMVSNIGSPRTDNNYGRAAAMLDEILNNE